MGFFLPADTPTLTRTARHRRQFVPAHLGARYLEIGAFDNPTVVREDGVFVKYADYFTADELRGNHADNPRRRLDMIRDVDFVVKGPRPSEFIDEIFDIIIANHVIEHVPDPISWFNDLRNLVPVDGAIFLTVPDKRYCFDYFKQPSDVIDLIRAFDEAKQQPGIYDIARMTYRHQRIDSKEIWAGEQPRPRSDSEFDIRHILEDAHRKARAGYVDVHCFYYTRDSFISIFNALSCANYIRWTVESVSEVRHNDCEFYVVLRAI